MKKAINYILTVFAIGLMCWCFWGLFMANFFSLDEIISTPIIYSAVSFTVIIAIYIITFKKFDKVMIVLKTISSIIGIGFLSYAACILIADLTSPLSTAHSAECIGLDIAVVAVSLIFAVVPVVSLIYGFNQNQKYVKQAAV